jgi:hypothetical protein
VSFSDLQDVVFASDARTLGQFVLHPFRRGLSLQKLSNVGSTVTKALVYGRLNTSAYFEEGKQRKRTKRQAENHKVPSSQPYSQGQWSHNY